MKLLEQPLCENGPRESKPFCHKRESVKRIFNILIAYCIVHNYSLYICLFPKLDQTSRSRSGDIQLPDLAFVSLRQLFRNSHLSCEGFFLIGLAAGGSRVFKWTRFCVCVVFFFGVEILPHAQYGPYYLTCLLLWSCTIMTDSCAGLFSLE